MMMMKTGLPRSARHCASFLRNKPRWLHLHAKKEGGPKIPPNTTHDGDLFDDWTIPQMATFGIIYSLSLPLTLYFGLQIEDKFYNERTAYEFAKKNAIMVPLHNDSSSSNESLLPVFDLEVHRPGRLLLVRGLLDSNEARTLDDDLFQLRKNKSNDPETQKVLTMPWLELKRIVRLYQRRGTDDSTEEPSKKWLPFHLNSSVEHPKDSSKQQNPADIMFPEFQSFSCSNNFFIEASCNSKDTTSNNNMRTRRVKMPLRMSKDYLLSNLKFSGWETMRLKGISPIQVGNKTTFRWDANDPTSISSTVDISSSPPSCTRAADMAGNGGSELAATPLLPQEEIGEVKISIEFHFRPRSAITFLASLSEDGESLIPVVACRKHDGVRVPLSYVEPEIVADPDHFFDDVFSDMAWSRAAGHTYFNLGEMSLVGLFLANMKGSGWMRAALFAGILLSNVMVAKTIVLARHCGFKEWEIEPLVPPPPPGGGECKAQQPLLEYPASATDALNFSSACRSGSQKYKKDYYV